MIIIIIIIIIRIIRIIIFIMIMISEFLGNLPWRERVKKSIECFESEREEQKHQQQAIGRILNHKKTTYG